MTQRKFLEIAVFFFTLLLTTASIAAESTSTPTATTLTDPGITSSLLKVVGGLLLVILAIFGSAWFYRRFGNISNINNESLKVIGGISMGQKDRVVLLQVGEQQLLLGVSPGRIQTLHVLPKPVDTVSASDASKPKFSSQLNAAIKQWKSS